MYSSVGYCPFSWNRGLWMSAMRLVYEKNKYLPTNLHIYIYASKVSLYVKIKLIQYIVSQNSINFNKITYIIQKKILQMIQINTILFWCPYVS